MRKKIVIITIFLLNIFTISVYAKYSYEDIKTVAMINIDKTPPIVNIEYSTIEDNVESVDVILHTNEEIRELENFQKIDNVTYKKRYTENINEKIDVEDISGNKTYIEIEIKNIINHPIEITCNKISNNNIKYPKFANKNSLIEILISTNKKYEITNNLESEKINVFVDDKEIDCNIEIKEIECEEDNQYVLKISDVRLDGQLKIKINEKFLMDKYNKYSLEEIINTEIKIDNLAPICNTLEELKESGSSQIKIIANEDIQLLDGWYIGESNNELYKEFPANVKYSLIIKDYAENESIIQINVMKATYIKLTYASHNSNIGWTYGYSNFDIAGLEAIKENPNYKTESLAIRIEGNVEEDFLQGRSYVYTYWGDSFYARCIDTGHIYSYGYNPNQNSWASLKSVNDLAYLGQEKYFQLGGAGINKIGQLALTGINPIPTDIALEYRYGISSIAFKLKDYSKYDVLYQIFVNNYGWIKTAKNEEETSVRHELPMSAIRMAIIPKSESNYLIENWDKDVGNDIMK